jgi:acetyltransferase-like isoleucine patch superfamily enzyme
MGNNGRLFFKYILSMIVGKHTYGLNWVKIKEWYINDGNLIIGSFCSLSPNVEFFLGGNHRVDWITTYPFGHGHTIDTFNSFNGEGHPSSKGDIIIENDVWIGDGAIIMSGIKISNGAVIGAKSLVTKNIGPYEIWGGNPAKFIKKRFNEETINFLLDLKWWDFPDDEINKIIPYLCSNDINSLKSYIENGKNCTG